jgi:hypothetical protein
LLLVATEPPAQAEDVILGTCKYLDLYSAEGDVGKDIVADHGQMILSSLEKAAEDNEEVTANVVSRTGTFNADDGGAAKDKFAGRWECVVVKVDRGIEKFLGETDDTEALDFVVVVIIKFELFNFVFGATDWDEAVGDNI